MLTYYFQAVLGWSPLHTGLAFLPAERRSVRLGVLRLRRPRPHPLRPAGWWRPASHLPVPALGILSTLSLDSGYLTTVLPAMVLLGLGMGGVFTPAIQIVTSGVSPATPASRRRWPTSRCRSAARSVSPSSTASLSPRPTATPDSPDPRAALVHGYATSAGWVAAALAAVVVLVVTGLRQTSPPSDRIRARWTIDRSMEQRRSSAMTVELNHTIVHVSDKNAAAEDLAEILGVAPPTTYGPFRVLTLANGVSLDFADDHGEPDGQHYAFLVSEEEFDAIQAADRRPRPDVLGRPLPPARRRDQHQRRRPRPVLGGPGRPQPRDHHGAVRRLRPRTRPPAALNSPAPAGPRRSCRPDGLGRRPGPSPRSTAGESLTCPVDVRRREGVRGVGAVP